MYLKWKSEKTENMEHISQNQLHNYEDVLEKIESKQKICNELKKKIQAIDNKIIATGLTLKQNVVKEKIFKLFVKVYHSIFDIYDQLSDKICQSEIEMLSNSSSKFYFIEIYVSKSFQERIIQNNWIVNVTLRSSTKRISKSFNLKEGLTNPISVVIPFTNSIDEVSADVYLIWPGERTWPVVKIASCLVDISYHFQLYTDTKIRGTLYPKIVKLSKLHHFKCSLKLPVVKCRLSSNVDLRGFLETLIKNSYHNWDPRKESCFSKTDHTAHAKTTTGFGNIITIELDTNANTLTLHASASELFYLKKYFLIELIQETYDIKRNIGKNIKVSYLNIIITIIYFNCYFLGPVRQF